MSDVDARLFPGFQSTRVSTGGAEINLVHGGKGPPLLLLHGYPQTHAIWHRIAPRLAERFTVVATDLRGYGDSSKPHGLPDHSNYSKRSMALDQVEVMQHLGFERFALVGHDRGGRVAHRLALDHPGRVTRLAVLDIVPTLTMYRRTTEAFARAYYHWFFLIRPEPFPERLIGADPRFFIEQNMGSRHAGLSAFSPDAFSEYVRCFSDPSAIHASCEDYRAAASIDLEHDEADLNRKLACPLLALWGSKGIIERCFSPLSDWRERAESVTAKALDCGHYLPEEAPDALLAELFMFLS